MLVLHDNPADFPIGDHHLVVHMGGSSFSSLLQNESDVVKNGIVWRGDFLFGHSKTSLRFPKKEDLADVVRVGGGIPLPSMDRW